MKLERSDVEFAVWRKKVDKSLFEHNGTTIPEWACRMWALPEIYGESQAEKILKPAPQSDITANNMTLGSLQHHTDARVLHSDFGTTAFYLLN